MQIIIIFFFRVMTLLEILIYSLNNLDCNLQKKKKKIAIECTLFYELNYYVIPYL